jgi:hypothetical protein
MGAVFFFSFYGLAKGATYGFTDGAIFTPNNSIKNSRSRGDSVWQSDKIWAVELGITRAFPIRTIGQFAFIFC